MEMNLKNLEKCKTAIWHERENECGFPLVQEFRDFVERNEVGDPKDYVDGDPEGEEAYLDGLESVSKRYVTAMRLIPKGKPYYNEKSSQPKRRYRKCFVRRFYLVNFVIDKASNRVYKRGTRFDWQHIVAEWNKSNPSDTLESSTLRVEYQRAIKDGALVLQVYIIQSNQILTNSWQPLQKQLKDMADTNPISFGMAAIAGQQLWNDTQPLISLLAEVIKKSPLFKEIEVHNPRQGARPESKLEAIVNMGDISNVVQDIENSNTKKDAQ